MAKTAEVNRQLTEAFKLRKVEKYYLAISHKKPRKKQGLVKGDMAPARRGAFKLLTTQENPAITQFFSKGIGAGRRLFLIKPHTGKTHQIRVALKSIGAPIAGDILYGDAQREALEERCYLHAYSIGFFLGGKRYRYTCMPKEGEHFCDQRFVDAMCEWLDPGVLIWPKIAGDN